VSHQQRFEALGLVLPPATKPIGLYKPVVYVGNQIWTSGHGPLKPDKSLITGRVGSDLTLEQGQAAARQVGLAMLATLVSELGTLDRIGRLVRTFGLVCCTSDFTDQPAVINGFSQLMADVFGPDAGIAARSAVGAPALPAGMAVEIEATFELRE
jgi:enamine deaminase RidA (YjgF/YER057c/UK114 family)